MGKKLSELIRDSTGQPSGGDQGRWQKELTNVAIDLIAILTNSGKATTLAATDAAAPALRRIERAAIAAATPISYHSRSEICLTILCSEKPEISCPCIGNVNYTLLSEVLNTTQKASCL